MTFLLCSGRRKFIDLIQIPIVSSNIAALETSIDGSIFFTCTTCIVYQYFKELVAFVLKAGAKVRALFLTTKLFRKFFYFFFLLISQALYAKGKECIKEKTKAVFFANRTAKIRTFLFIFQNFSEVFLFLSQAVLRFVTKSFSSRLSSLGKRVQKYSLSGYKTNIYHSFF